MYRVEDKNSLKGQTMINRIHDESRIVGLRLFLRSPNTKELSAKELLESVEHFVNFQHLKIPEFLFDGAVLKVNNARKEKKEKKC